MRKGFSLLTAIVFLVLVATISVLALTLSTQSAKQTTDIFLKAQAELLLRSGTEFAMLAMSGADYNATKCLNNVNISYNGTHDINITLSYLGSGLPASCTSRLANDVATDESNRTVIIDTWVRTIDGIVSEPIVMHRRSIQKP
ncbi:MAG TPA: type II secretion system protein [Sulfurospirillum arcachonense]|nr:type II secretion system protein [Sulfurospirillum arcachonense]